MEMLDEEDAFLQVKRRARSWFWGILRNKTRAHLRSRGRWVHRVPEESQDPPDHFVIRIPEILGRLPSSEAEVLVLRFMHGADLARVARHCGVSVPTAHRRVKRALEAARAEL
jgi:RNA polymerase sigma factor (sigma-70 family)